MMEFKSYLNGRSTRNQNEFVDDALGVPLGHEDRYTECTGTIRNGFDINMGFQGVLH